VAAHLSRLRAEADKLDNAGVQRLVRLQLEEQATALQKGASPAKVEAALDRLAAEYGL
jgi:hypothetical protein